MHLTAQLTRSSWAPMISLGSHQNIGLHTGARANVVLLIYLLISTENVTISRTVILFIIMILNWNNENQILKIPVFFQTFQF